MLNIGLFNNGLLLQLKNGFSLYAFKSTMTGETVVRVSQWMGDNHAATLYINKGKSPLFRAIMEASKLSTNQLMGWES